MQKYLKVFYCTEEAKSQHTTKNRKGKRFMTKYPNYYDPMYFTQNYLSSGQVSEVLELLLAMFESSPVAGTSGF